MADSRAKADWLVGMNASRALAIVSGSSNNSIGRVQTPTLAMICSRYRENRSFVSTPYWQLHVTLNGGTSHRRFFHPATFDDRQKAEAAYRSLSPDSQATVTKVERRRTLQQPPLLYDLTALQKDCNVHLDLPAAKTLDIAQSLYEKTPRPARGKDAGHRPVALREEAHFLPENGKPLHPARRDGLCARSAGKDYGHARIRHKCRNP